MIAAMAKNRVIGNQDALPRHFPEDLQFFKAKTTGKTLILGRKTHDAIAQMMGTKGPLLPGRHSVIMTRSAMDLPVSAFTHTTSEISHNFDELVTRYADANDEIMVIGGAEIYRLFLPYTQKIYLTEIHDSYDGDAFFPDFESDFTEISREKRGEFDFVEYAKK